MIEKVFRYMEKFQMIERGDHVIVGVSGGADSVCLLLLLSEYQSRIDFELKVVHVEHGIRGKESIEDALFVENLCKEKGIDYTCYHVDIPTLAAQQKLSTEEAARNERYRIFAGESAEWENARIAVAHNQNDQAETMLWNMVRGSGIRGAAGIRPVRENIIRPLLTCSRSEIEQMLKEENMSWREDRTNQEEEYTRNMIRNRIIPQMQEFLNTAVVEHFSSLGEELRAAEAYLQKETQKKFQQYCTREKNCIKFSVQPLLDEEEYMRERIFRYGFSSCGCGLKDITREHIRLMNGLLTMQSGRRIDLPEEWEAVREYGMIRLSQKTETEPACAETSLSLPGITKFGNGWIETRIFPYENQQIPQKTYTKWMNYDKINNALVIRTRHSGDYLVINVQGGKKKLKSYLTEEKIPAAKKDQVPLICLGQEVLWVIGHRISEAYKVDSQTKQILEITYKEE